jgi:MFS family permease
MVGSLLVASSLCISTFCESFWTYMIFYAMCYGSGIGITQSSNALALNTFFKDKRRIATGLSWSTTALGPIVWPYIITALLDVYNMEGTLLIFSAFALHAFMCSLLLQPVEWHTKFRETEEANSESKAFLEKDAESGYYEGKLSKASKSRSLLSSQYIGNEDDPHATGYEIIDPGTPMMVRANDGWYSQNRSLAGSRLSLSSNKTNKGSRIPSGQSSVAMSKRPSYSNLTEARSKRNSSVNLVQDGKERKRERKMSQSKPAIQEEEEHHENHTVDNSGEYHEKDVLKTAAKKLAEYKQERQEEDEEEEVVEQQKLSLLQKIYIFFDFDLFNDPVYVTLMLGITIANFVEINFSIITPMVLEEFHFGKYQIATFMSLLGATDILVRFFVPFIAGKIGWENRSFFLVGVLSMAFGRIILVHTRTYVAGLLVAVIIGAGKGLRTIFMALVIPTHVSLERLPAASGLQLATSGLFFLALGPAVGWIRDAVQTYVITLHILNILTYATAVAWTVERYLTNRKKSKVEIKINGEHKVAT